MSVRIYQTHKMSKVAMEKINMETKVGCLQTSYVPYALHHVKWSKLNAFTRPTKVHI